MRRLVPSTPGELAVDVDCKLGKVTQPFRHAKWVSVREIVNAAIAHFDRPDNPVESVTITFKIKGAA